MIRPININLNAAHPELPLVEATTFTGAPSSVFIRGVPKAVGNWSITAVNVAVTYPDNSTTTRAAVESAEGVWVATIPGTATSGRTTAGFRILADGIDENGAAVTGYVLGFADFAVLSFFPVPAPGETFFYLRYFDTMPTAAKKMDVTTIDGILKYYNGTTWLPFTDLTNYYTKAETDEAIDKIAAYYITADAQGNPFATHSALVNAQTYYSGGAVRTPTRNDYAVVSADETHDGEEWRYIYAVDAQGVGQWEPQYAVEGVIAYDNTVTRTSANGVKSSGIWSMIWGALSALPTGFSSLYDWCVSQLADKLDSSSAAPAWVSGTAYTANALVSYNGVVYQNTSGGTIQSTTPPDTSGSGWTATPVSDLFLPLTGGTVVGKVSFREFSGGYLYLSKIYNTGDGEYTFPYGKTGTVALTSDIPSLAGLAPLASPAFTGTPTAPTPTAGDNSTKVATTAFVQGALQDKANRVANPTAGNLAALDANGNLTDSGKKPADFASEAEAEALRDGKLDKSDVVSPSTSATTGQAASAKATGDALVAVTPDWVQTSAYAAYDCVKYNGAYYYAKTDIAANTAWNANNWGSLANLAALAHLFLPLTGGTMSGVLEIFTGDPDGVKRIRAGYNNEYWTGLCTDGLVQRQGNAEINYTLPTSEGRLALESQIPSIDGLAPLASPAFTGTPTAPTPTAGDNSTKIATTAFVQGALQDKADAADLHYSFNTATVSSGTTPTVTDLSDRAINTATLGSTVTAATVTLPAATANRARDFFIDLTIEATTAPTLTFIDPATNTTANVTYGADSLADIDTGKNAVLFTEFPNYTWIVSVKHEEVSA